MHDLEASEIASAPPEPADPAPASAPSAAEAAPSAVEIIASDTALKAPAPSAEEAWARAAIPDAEIVSCEPGTAMPAPQSDLEAKGTASKGSRWIVTGVVAAALLGSFGAVRHFELGQAIVVPEVIAPSEPMISAVEAERAIEALRSELAMERDARSSAEGKTAELRAELEARAGAVADAERAKGELESGLQAERKARIEAEEAARAAQREMSALASPALESPAIVAPEAPSPARQPQPAVQPGPVVAPKLRVAAVAPKPRPALPAPPDEPASVDDAAHAALAEGQRLFARGDIAAARTAFRRAIERGLPEAALAMGTTYDPVSLSRVGARAPADPARARHWYRRAHELALSASPF
jgi:hypothetical protein